MTKAREQLTGHFVVGFCGFFLRVVSTKPIVNAVFVNFSPPPFRPLLKMDTFVAGCFTCDMISVCIVLASSTKPKIGSSVIKSVAVSMVNFLLRLSLQKDPVHEKGVFTFSAYRATPDVKIPTIAMYIPFVRLDQRPILVREPDNMVADVKNAHVPNMGRPLCKVNN